MRFPGYTKVYLTAWLVGVVAMPWYILPGSISIGLLFIVWMADGRFPQKWTLLKSTPWTWPFLLFFLLHVIGLFYSEDMKSAWFQIETKLSVALLPIIAATGRRLPSGYFRVMKYGFIGSCLAVALLSLGAAAISYQQPLALPLNFDPYSTERLHTLFPNLPQFWEYFSYLQLSKGADIHPAFFSMYLIFCILVILQEMLDRQRVSFVRVCLIGFFMIFVSMLSSRMAIISLAVTLAFLVMHHYYTKENATRGILALSCLLALVFAAVWINPVSRFHIWVEPMSTPLTVSQKTAHWNSVNLRLLSWEASVDAGKSYWPFGAGTGDGQSVLDQYYARLSFFGFHVNSHNQYLQTFIELGIPGLACLLFCLYGPAYRALSINPLHFSFMLLFGMMCLSESMLVRPKGIVFFAMFQSLFLSYESSAHD